MPIPDFLQPSSDKNREQNKNNENVTKKTKGTPKLLAKTVVPGKTLTAKTYGFLQSLDGEFCSVC